MTRTLKVVALAAGAVPALLVTTAPQAFAGQHAVARPAVRTTVRAAARHADLNLCLAQNPTFPGNFICYYFDAVLCGGGS
jgi:hypothetical protein